MRRALGWLAVSAGVALAAAGCGGQKKYSLAATRACLVKQGIKPTPPRKTDIVAQFATGGALRVVFGRENEVTVSFAADQKQANNLALGYHRFAGRNIGLADVLRPQGNAVLLWEAHPSVEQLSTIGNCLK
jgi:hypothetical protein